MSPASLELIRERVLPLIDERGPDECWPWLGTITGDGYGQIQILRRTYLAHRLVHLLFHGDPGSLDVMHSCDNPPCCNPRHLSAGTKAQNQHDKKKRGRAAKGEANKGGGRLHSTDVRAIRRALARGETKTAIGKRFGVSRTEVWHIATGKHWSHVI